MQSYNMVNFISTFSG